MTQQISNTAHMKDTRTILLECAEEFQSLSDENWKIARTHSTFYTKQMISKMAQTYKHCASMLREKAMTLSPTRSDPPDDRLCPVHPTAPIRSYTDKHHPQPMTENDMTPGFHRQSIGYTGPAGFCRALSRTFRCWFGKSKSFLLHHRIAAITVGVDVRKNGFYIGPPQCHLKK